IGVDVADVGEGAGHLRHVAGEGADRQGAVGGDVDVVRVVEHEGGAGAAVEGDAAQQGPVAVEVGDDVVPGRREDVAGRVDGGAGGVGGGGAAGADQAHADGVVDVALRTRTVRGVEQAVLADVQVDEVHVAEAGDGAVGQVETDDTVLHAPA